MSSSLSANTQAILLLTAPLVVGRSRPAVAPLAPGEYHRLARCLDDSQREPADLLGPEAQEVLADAAHGLEAERLAALLGRGFLLGQAVEAWSRRAIWVTSRAEPDYPERWKQLRKHRPPVLYGCGERRLLDGGGLAVVGSRNTSEERIAWTEAIGRLAAAAGRTLVSGGARGVDQAAMRGALDAGGQAVAVLANGLAQTATQREHRQPLMEGRLALVSPYDPAAGFHPGNAMARNKLVYALADAALVVDSDCGRGGTWAGAIEQLERFRSASVHVHLAGEPGEGLRELRNRGARAWPEPKTPEDLRLVLDEAPPEPAARSLFPPPPDAGNRAARE